MYTIEFVVMHQPSMSVNYKHLYKSLTLLNCIINLYSIKTYNEYLIIIKDINLYD